MNDTTARSVHWSFWLIGIVALIWNVMGVMNYLWQMNADSLSAIPETHRAIVEGRPAWATAGFAIGVFGGALGCLLLLFKKSAAVYFFVLSLIGVIVTMVHAFSVADVGGFSAFELVMMMLLPLLVAIFLVWYTKSATLKGWIR